MIESWDDAVTLKQREELLVAAMNELDSLEKACQNNDVQVRLEIAYMNGSRLCFYPKSNSEDLSVKDGYGMLVVEFNFGKAGAWLSPVDLDLNLCTPSWAVKTFKLTPKFLREFALKLHAKVYE